MTTRTSILGAARSARWLVLAAAAAAFVFPQPALAKRSEPATRAAPAAPAATVELELQRQADRELAGVYAARHYRPLWLGPQGSPAPAAQRLVELVQTASLDQIDSASLRRDELEQALERVRIDTSPAALASAELALSRAFVDYVRAIRRAPAMAMTYEHQSLRPSVPARDDALWAAASAPSLADYVGQMRWMHPLYAPLRRAALAAEQSGASDPALLENLARVRALPPMAKGRALLVDAASARLWMYEDGRPVDTMKVVVGKPTLPTPMLAGYVRHAIVNPYWNVPEDLVRDKIVPNVLKRGVGYLKAGRYQVLDSWSPDAQPVDPATIDWREVASGARDVRVRQLPGDGNAMGLVKFEFPNPLGIYLHDTPDKHLLREELRQFSSGCVRLEDAVRLGNWLLQAPLPTGGDEPERKVGLPQIVPVYITYLTAHPEGGAVAMGPDPYKRDVAARLALAGPDGSSDAVAR